MAILAIITGFVFAAYFILSILKQVSDGVDSGFEALALVFKVLFFSWCIVGITMGFTHC